jgi:hypothetical protein
VRGALRAAHGGKPRDFAECKFARCAAPGIVAESPQESASALSEDLERKARFLALCAKKAPKFRITNELLNRLVEISFTPEFPLLVLFI